MSGCSPWDRQWNLQGKICEALLVRTCLLVEGGLSKYTVYVYIHIYIQFLYVLFQSNALLMAPLDRND